MTIGHLSTPSTSGFSVNPDKSGLELTVTLDLRQESAATLQVVGALNYLDSSTMSEWGISLLDNDSAASIPVITSDGIRMAYHNGLVPSLDDMLANFPMDAIGDSIGEFVPGTNVTMEPMAFVESSDIPGYDLEEKLPALILKLSRPSRIWNALVFLYDRAECDE